MSHAEQFARFVGSEMFPAMPETLVPFVRSREDTGRAYLIPSPDGKTQLATRYPGRITWADGSVSIYYKNGGWRAFEQARYLGAF